MRAFPLLRPLLFSLDPERAHRLTIAMLKAMPRRTPVAHDPALAVRVGGLDFPSPVGLAAGVDKDAEVPDAFLSLGFGFVEVGTITPLPQSGNPRPRLFRLVEDRAVINRMGFNNGGQAAALARLHKRAGRPGLVGVNIGANKDAVDRVADYATGVRTMAPVASYLTINISSPNTPGLRALQDAAALDELLHAALEARGAATPPIFLKVAPDLAVQDMDAIARVALDRRIDGLIVSNTTISRPALRSAHAGEAGGLSGAPLKDLALERLHDFRRATGGALPLIAAGGIASGADAFARIKAGATLVQLYSALVYGGPGLARRIEKDMLTLIKDEGHRTILTAIGSDG
ncbi:quinone-dependent dihydroorotate dehydrogenase [uncultured Sphingomonas sp.]|uniref:quinone-dependent dihydroorotate dehydrogenase n=1 Tax=uncultured Sphingomonas sp. TaxID=158754 RepID=UPI0025EF6A4C|nr:quinone-dependent dihydroorotate dehydrogenase [uncultured Sphingomonas sp.]